MKPTVELKLKDGRLVVLEDPGVRTVEALATGYEPGDYQREQAKVLREQAEASVKYVGQLVMVTAGEARAQFPLVRDWTTIIKAYSRMMKMDGISAFLKGLREKPFGDSVVGLNLPSGSSVVLRPMSIDLSDKIDRDGKYQATDFMRCLHDKIAASIVQVDGNQVDPAVFDARVQFPNYSDWLYLSAAYTLINGDEEDIEAFFPDTRPSPDSTKRQPSSCTTGSSLSARSPDAP